MQFIAVDVFINLFTLFVFNYKALFADGKDRTCLKIEVPDYCLNIFGSIFGVVFCLLIKKLILGSKTNSQNMRKFPCAVWSVKTFPHMDKEETFFFFFLDIGMVWLFVDSYIFSWYCKLSWIELFSFYLQQCLSIDLFSYWTPGHSQKGPMNKVCLSVRMCSWNWLFSFFWNSAWC